MTEPIHHPDPTAPTRRDALRMAAVLPLTRAAVLPLTGTALLAGRTPASAQPAVAETHPLAALLAEEHAAVFLYGVLGPRLPDRLGDAARTAYDDHRRHRDALLDALHRVGVTPSPALPAYATPPAGSPTGAAIAVEEAMLLRWRAAVGAVGREHRALCAASYVDEARHLTLLRGEASPFPCRA